jgi:hypothetical protein
MDHHHSCWGLLLLFIMTLASPARCEEPKTIGAAAKVMAMLFRNGYDLSSRREMVTVLDDETAHLPGILAAFLTERS